MLQWNDGTNYLMHYGIKGQKWGVRRFQNPDGTLTEAGKGRYNKAVERSKRYSREADRQIEMHGGKAGAQMMNSIKTALKAIPLSAVMSAAPVLSDALYWASYTSLGEILALSVGGLAVPAAAGLAYVAYNGARMAAAIKDSAKAQDVVVSGVEKKS